MKIIDAHQHFWDLDTNYIPWLTDRPVEFRYGDYSSLKRNYMPADYRKDTAGFDIAGSVFIETEYDRTRPLGEVEWVGRVRAETGLPTVMVAQAWLDRHDAESVLGAHGQTDFVRGIRHKPAAAAWPEDVVPGAPGSMGDPEWRRGFAMLEPNGLSFDLQTPWWHLREAADLAEAFPDTEIILNHTGLPADRSAAGLAGWREAMRTLAQAPNAAVKISGIGVPGEQWTADLNRGVIMETIEIFGVERAMFASNFPVDSLAAPFATIYAGFMEVTGCFSDADRRALFYDNAMKFYRIDERQLLK